MVARCVFWLIIGAMLYCLFLFRRKKFQQVMLVAGLSTGAEVLLRLFSLQTGDASELVFEGYFVAAIGVVYLLVWLGMRYLNVGARSGTRKNH